jgi:hypothetical protein
MIHGAGHRARQRGRERLYTFTVAGAFAQRLQVED